MNRINLLIGGFIYIATSDMIKKLAEEDLVNYKRHQGVSLTDKGKLAAKMIVRNYRLWEVFLVGKLDFY